jgi:glucan-binding YG repeat protein
MRKQTKLAVGVSAAALLAIGASMTSFAATRGWVNEGDAWYYYDNNGDYVTDKWKTYNGNSFYLGDDGYMLTNELVEYKDNYYYVDANGAMVKNTWVAIAADDDETEDVDYRWYYFGPAGKAYTKMNKTINGKKYSFDDNGKMLFGFSDENGELLNEDVDDPILHCMYYFGSNDDGARYSGWLKYEDGFEDDSYDDDDYYWFNFASDGKKRSGKSKKINGKWYGFDDNGVMVTEFTDGKGTDTSLTATNSKFYSDNLEDGSLQKSAWIRTSMPDEWNVDDDDDHWFRTNSQGYLLYNCTKKINSKWYAFNENGVMLDGLVLLSSDDGVSGAKPVYDQTSDGKATIDEDNWEADDIYKLTFATDTGKGTDTKNYDGLGLYYFSGDEEKDGSMKTGSSVKISLADDDYTFYFQKTTGQAINGPKSNKLYRNGILQKASSDNKYEVAQYTNKDTETLKYLVNTSGTICKPNHYYKDGNDVYYVVTYANDENDEAGYTIDEYYSAEAAKAALK